MSALQKLGLCHGSNSVYFSETYENYNLQIVITAIAAMALTMLIVAICVSVQIKNSALYVGEHTVQRSVNLMMIPVMKTIFSLILAALLADHIFKKDLTIPVMKERDPTPSMSMEFKDVSVSIPGKCQFLSVQVGDVVDIGTVLCQVEFMKLIHTVRADVKGKVIHIFADKGEILEADAPILRIEKMS